MGVVDREVDDQVDGVVGEHVVERLVDRPVEARGQRLGPLALEVLGADEPQAGLLVQGLRVALGDVAAADDRQAERAVGAHPTITDRLA